VKVVTDQESNTVSYSNFTEGLKTVFTAGGFDSRNFNEPLRKLPGYYGGIVFTKTDYAIFHTEFEQIAQDVKEQELGIELLNCTEGGAYIKGFNHISLRRAYDMVSELKQDIDLTVKLKNIMINKDTSGRRQQLAKSLKIMRDNLRAAGISAAKCRHLVQRAIQSGQIGSLAAEEKNLIALVQKTLFISLAAQEKIIHALKLGSEAQSLSESLAASNILFRVITEVTSELIPAVDQTLRGLKMNSAGRYDIA
jgi:hypothetical protein